MLLAVSANDGCSMEPCILTLEDIAHARLLAIKNWMLKRRRRKLGLSKVQNSATRSEFGALLWKRVRVWVFDFCVPATSGAVQEFILLTVKYGRACWDDPCKEVYGEPRASEVFRLMLLCQGVSLHCCLFQFSLSAVHILNSLIVHRHTAELC